MLVDVILLSRDLSPPRPDIWEGLRSQGGVNLVIHRQVGAPRPGDRNRWETIARARNEARAVGSRPWVMFLDDDVVLGPDMRGTPGRGAAAEARVRRARRRQRGGDEPAGRIVGSPVSRRDGRRDVPPRGAGRAYLPVGWARSANAFAAARICARRDGRSAIYREPRPGIGPRAPIRPASPRPEPRADVTQSPTRSGQSDVDGRSHPRGLRSTRPQPVSHAVPDHASRRRATTSLSGRSHTACIPANGSGWRRSPA